jgi:hypothetical protein
MKVNIQTRDSVEGDTYNEHRSDNDRELREHICLGERLNYEGMCSSEV